MAFESLKQNLLAAAQKVAESRAEPQQLDLLLQLGETFYQSFTAQDIKGRRAEDLFGCAYGLLHFLESWDECGPKVRLLNPEMESHGWENHHTIVTVVCSNMPFLTASVRGELNLRGLPVHVVNSCNIQLRRDDDGRLLGLGGPQAESELTSKASLLYFEINRISDPPELTELRRAIEEIVGEVSLVVADFEPMRARLQACVSLVADTVSVDSALRQETNDFLVWLERFHIAYLGYEYLSVEREGGKTTITRDEGSPLGLMKTRVTRGDQDLARDVAVAAPSELLRKQLSFSKSRIRSRVHRLAYPDYIEIKEYDEAGEVVGQHRFLGLYTSSVYTTSPRVIPVLRRKVEAVMSRSGLDSQSHAGRELLRVLELFPRDELFQSSISELYETATAINDIQERRQIRLFVRADVHGKFFSCLVYVPKDRFNTELRVVIQRILGAALGAEDQEFTTQFTESVLVRCHFVLRVDPAVPVSFDINEIEEQIVQATLSWEDRLRERLVEEFGEERGVSLSGSLGQGFPPGYRDDFDPRIAVLDIKKIQHLQAGQLLATSFYRLLEEGDNMLRLRLFSAGEPLPLSDVLPILENLGLRVVRERPYGVRASTGEVFWIQEFSLIYSLSHDIVLEKVRDEFIDAFSRIWFGEAESDSFNRLLIGTQLSWREIALLRAYARYLRQLQFNYSVDYVAETMANHLHIASAIVELFLTRFSPVFDGDEDWRSQREAAVELRILESLDSVENLSEDRIIRTYLAVIKATLRTNFFQQDDEGELKPYFSFKLQPTEIPDVPPPVPMYEIFVYSPRVEGVHLRGGKVARGGLRWSDRMEDFRTEVLGLVKAQQVKNAVIVPVGAKGGFVAKKLTSEMSRDETQAEGIACYKLFIQGLLDITDNRTDEGIVGPRQVVAKDEPDPYLVVAADKGTATFSDIANGISEDYGFWLDDAFASGGSVGYDHKKMGITAKGAWVSVQRHFREMGIDCQNTDFTVVGIGDMGGDVFGNGMLLSNHIRLVAAFNHIHIFIDPEPDATASFAERERLFDLPRSGWNDFDPELISEGGGVFLRSAKTIQVSPQMKRRFDIVNDHLTPNELISHLLRGRVDLLWNGGIGTYVKGSTESHTDVGDKANDGLRVDADQLRCKIIGEGGNLGVTQLGRVEFGLGGGHSNTDFIDNVGGVDCSDHEVNIKILLNAVVDRGDLTERHRNNLLEEMTDSVAELVLHNNYRQAQAISLVESQALNRAGEYRRFIGTLESRGNLDRGLEFLPSDDELTERRARGQGLTRPELSILVSYSKAILKDALIQAELGEDELLARAVTTAFPPRLRELYPEEIQQHRLHKEILATQIANDVVNRMGLNFLLRLQKATGASFGDAAKAYIAVTQIFDVPELWWAVESLDHKIESEMQFAMMTEMVRLVRRASRWLLRNRREELQPSALVEEFAEGVALLRRELPGLLKGAQAAGYIAEQKRYEEAGVPEDLASMVAGAGRFYTVLGVIQAAREAGAGLMEVAQLYFALGQNLELDWFATQINAAKVENEWQARARDTYLEDLEWQQRALALGALRFLSETRDVEACVASWQESQSKLLERWRDMLVELHTSETPDFSMFAVANRELLDLAQSSLRQD